MCCPSTPTPRRSGAPLSSTPDLANLLKRQDRHELYSRLQCFGIFTMGQLESALQAKELLHLDRDALKYLQNTVSHHQEVSRPVRSVVDRVHGHISFSSDLWEAVIDTGPFQRLRHLKQMGGACWVFPNAVHTRFEHSLGVGYLAGQWFDLLKHQLRLQGNVSELNAVKTGVQIAGLCHDLGHGPLSHAFEVFVNDQNPGLDWHHEQMSLKLFDYIVDNSHLTCSTSIVDVLDRYDGCLSAKDIKAMMIGESLPLSSNEDDPTYILRKAAGTIVANKLDGFDVDRFDYLQRDTTVAKGLPRINSERLMINSSVDAFGHIVFNEKVQTDVFNFYRCRYDMFKNVYLHKNNQAVEFMLRDILKEVEPIFRISECLSDAEDYLSLTDGCVMEWFNAGNRLRRRGLLSLDEEFVPNFERADKLVKRLQTRSLYTYIGELTADDSSGGLKGITAEKIYELCDFPGDQLKLSDIVVTRAKISHGAPLGCPWKSVLFYRGQPDETFHMDENQWSYYPKEWVNEKLLVYCRRENPNIWEYIKNGIRKLTQIDSSVHCSPHHETRSSKILHDRYTYTPSRRR